MVKSWNVTSMSSHVQHVSVRQAEVAFFFFFFGSHYLVAPPCVCTGCGQVKAQEELQNTKNHELFTLGLKILGKWTSWCLSTVRRDSRRGRGAALLSTRGARPRRGRSREEVLRGQTPARPLGRLCMAAFAYTGPNCERPLFCSQ